MKSFTLFPVLFFLVACSSGTPEYDATGTFEATDVVVSAEASGKILGLDVEEGTVLKGRAGSRHYRHSSALSEKTPVGSRC